MRISFEVKKEILDTYEYIEMVGTFVFDRIDKENNRTSPIDVDPESYVGKTLSFFKNNNLEEVEIIIIGTAWYINWKTLENKTLYTLKFGAEYIKKEFWR